MPEIVSSSDPKDPRPWFEFDLDLTAMTVGFAAANGLAACKDAPADEQAEQAIKDNSRHSIVVSSQKSMERHVLAVALEGTIEFVPESEQRHIYYAHLAWYDPETDSLDRLRFVE